MIRANLLTLSSAVLALLASPALADLPYNPTRIILSSNASSVYLFSPASSSSQFQLERIALSDTIDPSHPNAISLSPTLPFLSEQSSIPFIPVINDEGDITVLSGDCGQGLRGTQLWGFVADQDNRTGKWAQLSISSEDSSIHPSFLSAGISFPPTETSADPSMYVFGGMCPGSTVSNITASAWTSNATYSNHMIQIAPAPVSVDGSFSTDPHDLSTTGERGPPIPEAGLTITPLLPTYANASTSANCQGQNYVLLGGHTQGAFINMSQVALFSLPESSWSFLEVDGPSDNSKTDLMTRDTVSVVEPRSGHTAILSEDGSKIIVLGGWVGDVSTPAQPQLAVLQIGQGYGGSDNWSWSIPSVTNSPFQDDQGIYGHGAAMLPGGVMMVAGGYSVTSSPSSRLRRRVQATQIANTQMLLFNTTSYTWISNYTLPVSSSFPASVSASGGALSTSAQKVGFGVGLVLGLLILAVIIAVYRVYSRRLRRRREIRQGELRELALGAEKFQTSALDVGEMEDRGGRYPDRRSASWGDRQEKRIGFPSGNSHRWVPLKSSNEPTRRKCQCDLEGKPITLVETQRRVCECSAERRADEEGEAERTGVLVDNPSPTRGLRKNVAAKGPVGYGQVVPSPSQGPSQTHTMMSTIHRIDEMEEESSESGSAKRKLNPRTGVENLNPAYGDPFKDPLAQHRVPREQLDPARQQREQEIQGWVNDWSAAAAAMEVSRNASQAGSHRRAPSSLSGTGSTPHSGDYHSGRGSPEKSDRTGSNLSEHSLISATSIQRSVVGSISRTMSLRSASAGYALVSGAAAAVAARVGGHTNPSIEDVSRMNSGRRSPVRTLSRRSASLNFSSDASSRRPKMRERSDTFSTARTSLGPTYPSEGEALLGRSNSQLAAEDDWATPPQTPIRDHPGSSGAGAGGWNGPSWMGSVRRVLSRNGNGNEDFGVRRRVADINARSETTRTPTQGGPAVEAASRRAASASATFWQGKRGAKDWEQDGCDPDRSSSILKNSHGNKSGNGGGSGAATLEDDSELLHDDAEEWDVEAAVQKRVVQVMFTVPKEKLRVVNVDSLSLLSSKSDAGGEGEGNERRDPGEDKSRMIGTVREEREEEEEEEEEDDDGDEDGMRIRDMYYEERPQPDPEERGIGRGSSIKGKGKAKAMGKQDVND